MQHWLSKLHEFFLDREPFVVATACAYHGSSPEKPGAALFHSSKKTYRITSSDTRYQAMLHTAADLLVNPTSFRIDELALGKVAGRNNGQCEVIYEYFDAQQYPDWLRKLRICSHDGVSSTLLCEFDVSNSNIKTTVLREIAADKAVQSQHQAGLDCQLKKNTKSIQLLRMIQSDTITVSLIGDHPVADEIQKQCIHLPIETVRLKSMAEHTSEQNIVIILTTDHELDYQYCETLLKQSTSDRPFFVGCIGSVKKAQIFADRLLLNGVSKGQLNQLHMPVGLAEIRGKQNSVIAASIIAQILARHDW